MPYGCPFACGGKEAGQFVAFFGVKRLFDPDIIIFQWQMRQSENTLGKEAEKWPINCIL
jgi:hypothetical protein